MPTARVEGLHPSLLHLIPGGQNSYGSRAAGALLHSAPLPKRAPGVDRQTHVLDLVRNGRLPPDQFITGTLSVIADLQTQALPTGNVLPQSGHRLLPQSYTAAEFTYCLGEVIQFGLQHATDTPLSYSGPLPKGLSRERIDLIAYTIFGWINELVDEGQLSEGSLLQIGKLVTKGIGTSTACQIAYITANLIDFLSRCENGIQFKSPLHSYSRLVRSLLRPIHETALWELQRSAL